MRRPVTDNGEPINITDNQSVRGACKWFEKLQKAMLNFVTYSGAKCVLIATPPYVTNEYFMPQSKKTLTVLHHGNWIEMTKAVLDHAGESVVQSFDLSTNVLHTAFGGGWQSIQEYTLKKESLTEAQKNLMDQQPAIAFEPTKLPRTHVIPNSTYIHDGKFRYLRPDKTKFTQFKHTPKRQRSSSTTSSKPPKKKPGPKQKHFTPPPSPPDQDNNVVYDWESLMNYPYGVKIVPSINENQKN